MKTPIKIGGFLGCECQPLFDFLQTQNLPGIEWVMVDLKNWREAGCDVYLLSQNESTHIMSMMPRLSSEVRSTGACDILLKENGDYWPHNILGSVLAQILIERCPQLNTQAYAYVTGDGAWARTIIAVIIQMGFAKINWVCLEPEKAELIANEIRTAYFGVKLQVMSGADLNLQPNNGSLLINTLSIDEYPDMLVDLTYLNFIQKGGLVVDMPLLPFEKNILSEAENVGIFTLHGAEIAWRWWAQVCAKNKLSVMENLKFEDFESFLKSRPRPS